MSNTKQHYQNVLSDVYSWMHGGHTNGVEKYTEFFNTHNISPTSSGQAYDLGAGCGFQSIPLARRGFTVRAIDLDQKLLDELIQNAGDLPIEVINDDILKLDKYNEGEAELVVCMTDTINHLSDKQSVQDLFAKSYRLLQADGRLILSFRDYSIELYGADRFIPVRSDDTTIFSCFLEYSQEIVYVHDIIYKKNGGNWQLTKGRYKKLKLSKDWVMSELTQMNFRNIHAEVENGMTILFATK